MWQEAAEGWAEHDDPEPSEPWYIDAHNLVLEPVDVESHRFTIVVLHSCSGGPDDFVPFFHHLKLPFRSQIRAVVPCSPKRRENHYGYETEMNSWFEYDDQSQDGNGVKDRRQLLEQRERIVRLLEAERRKLAGEGRRLLLWGLSQGAGLAVDAALHAPFTVGGVIALRGMALRESLEALPMRSAEEARPLQVLAINGKRDWLCPPEAAGASYEALRPHGASVRFEAEPSLGHACARGRQRLNRFELEKVSRFLSQVWDGL